MTCHVLELTFSSETDHADPFNDLEVDVVFERNARTWRVPAFWRGAGEWTVRFAPPEPGVYTHRVECSGGSDPGLDGREGRSTAKPYGGDNELLRRGSLRVSADRRHFEHEDGTPFPYLADTWWTGMSDRLPWDGFQRLLADRVAKGFTAIQLVAGLVPLDEEHAPVDAGFANEGGPCWTAGFERIDPGYWDAMDRRMAAIVDAGLVPVVVGAWGRAIDRPGPAKLRQHWRYIVARYAAHPVLWIAGGEVVDPPPGLGVPSRYLTGGWTDVVRYIKDIDAHRRPLSVHEVSPDVPPVGDETLLDFRFFQPAHFGERSLAVEVAQLNVHHARSTETKPLIVAEIGYEGLGGGHLHDFQRAAFWLGALNGAAGHGYGAVGVFESYDAERPLHRSRWSFTLWDEGMHFPGSTQVGLGSRLLRTLPWHRFEPRPDWITPGGTTLLEERRPDGPNELLIELSQEFGLPSISRPGESEWRRRGGSTDGPYAAGVDREVRVVYIGASGLYPHDPPTVLALEDGVRYHAEYWDPSTGLRVDLGLIGRPKPGTVEFDGPPPTGRGEVVLVDVPSASDKVVSVDAASDADTTIVLRYRDPENFLRADYVAADRRLRITERTQGVDADELVSTDPALISAADVRLTVEVRGRYVACSITGDGEVARSRIVRTAHDDVGGFGIAERDGVRRIEVRESPRLADRPVRDRRLVDASGVFRGILSGPGMPQHPGMVSWDDYGERPVLLLDAYLPERLPTPQDWVLLLDARPVGVGGDGEP